jgi:hypothetical protein
VLAALIVVPTASASTCSSQDRFDQLTRFFAAWHAGDPSGMALDRPAEPTAPFGFLLPRSHKPNHRPWRRELQGPVSWKLASVRAWIRRRVAAGDRMTLLKVNILNDRGNATGGILAYRRTAPDIRHGHNIYGVAKFEVRCNGVTALGGGISWWTRTSAITICHPGYKRNGTRVCGRLPRFEPSTFTTKVPRSLLYI